MRDDPIDILIVEDSQTQALYLQIILEEQGYRVTLARNGLEGLNLLQKQFFPIVITDWIMPEMDGYEFCQAIRRQHFPGYVYIILLTAKNSKHDIISGLEAGADDYLVKEVDKSELFARLNTAKRIITLEHSLRKRNQEIALLSVTIAHLSITDSLTRTYNRGYLNDNLSTAVKYAFEENYPLSLVICDIDHFKNINDRYGHQVGDNVLREFASCLKQAVREETDWVARYGGEEFVVVLPGADLESAYKAAERYRRLISEITIPHEIGPIKVTASFGVSCIAPEENKTSPTMESLIAVADECLYHAKEEGRNRSFCAWVE